MSRDLRTASFVALLIAVACQGVSGINDPNHRPGGGDGGGAVSDESGTSAGAAKDEAGGNAGDESSSHGAASAIVGGATGGIGAAGERAEAGEGPCGGVTVTGSCLPTGLVAYWAGEGDTTDSANDHDGAPEGAIEYTAGVTGQAFYFDEPGSGVKIPDAPDLNPTAGFSLVAWGRLDEDSINPLLNRFEAHNLVFKDGGGFGARQILLNYFGPTVGVAGHAWMAEPASEYLYTTWSGLELKRWYHFALTYDLRELKLYIDGTARMTDRKFHGPVWVTSSPWRIGHDPYFRDDWHGAVDEVMLFSRCITPEEVRSLHGLASPPTLPAIDTQSGLVLFFRGDSLRSRAAGIFDVRAPASLRIVSNELLADTYAFDGTGPIEVADSPALSGEHLTVAAWFNASAETALAQTIVSQEDGLVVADRRFSVRYLPPNSLVGRIWLGDVEVEVAFDALAPDAWHHVAMTWDASKLVLYVDGDEVDRSSAGPFGALTDSDAPFRFGGSSDALSEHLRGMIDDVRLYTRALTSLDIAAINGR